MNPIWRNKRLKWLKTEAQKQVRSKWVERKSYGETRDASPLDWDHWVTLSSWISASFLLQTTSVKVLGVSVELGGEEIERRGGVWDFSGLATRSFASFPRFPSGLFKGLAHCTAPFASWDAKSKFTFLVEMVALFGTWPFTPLRSPVSSGKKKKGVMKFIEGISFSTTTSAFLSTGHAGLVDSMFKTHALSAMHCKMTLWAKTTQWLAFESGLLRRKIHARDARVCGSLLTTVYKILVIWERCTIAEIWCWRPQCIVSGRGQIMLNVLWNDERIHLKYRPCKCETYLQSSPPVLESDSWLTSWTSSLTLEMEVERFEKLLFLTLANAWGPPSLLIRRRMSRISWPEEMWNIIKIVVSVQSVVN